MLNKLYGDGVHDDLPAIQEMLDSGVSMVYLPVPEKHYLISGEIRIHSNQELKLDRYTKVVLKENSNTAMLKNAKDSEWDTNITISGGIWDMNHNNQNPNPWHYPNPETNITLSAELLKRGYRKSNVPDEDGNRGEILWAKQGWPDDVYTGFCFILNSVKDLNIHNLTIENPVMYGMDLSCVEDFTIENIKFDYFEGSPKLWNLDGIHLEGGCKNGVIRNLKGACHDDTVALTSDDAYLPGPIENITIDGIYAQKSHSAVRLLSRVTPLRNIHISNIYGTYYVYCIIISKNSGMIERSAFENITIDNVYASFCEGTVDVPGNYGPLIAIGHDIDIKELTFSEIYRNETHLAKPTIGIDDGACIENLAITNAVGKNFTDAPMALIENKGVIKKLTLNRIIWNEDEKISGSGIIEEIKE